MHLYTPVPTLFEEVYVFSCLVLSPFSMLNIAQLLQKFECAFSLPKEGDITYKHNKIHTCFMLRSSLLTQAGTTQFRKE